MVTDLTNIIIPTDWNQNRVWQPSGFGPEMQLIIIQFSAISSSTLLTYPTD